MQYLYSVKIQIQTSWAKAGTIVLLNNYGTKGSFLSLLLLKLQGFPLIAGDLEGSEQLFHDSAFVTFRGLAPYREKIVWIHAQKWRI